MRFIGPAPETGNVYTVQTGVSGGDALWDFSFSIDDQPNGVGSTTLGDYTYSLAITDSAGLLTPSPITFDPTTIADNDAWGPTGRTIGVTAASWGAQNSENLSFFPPIGFDPNAVDNYFLTLTEKDSTGAIDSTATIEIDAVGAATPEPGTIGLFGLGLAGLALISRKFARKSSARPGIID